MAGLKTLNENFKKASARVHLNSPSGHYPLYLIKEGKTGKLDVLKGTWEAIKYLDGYGNTQTREPTVEECATTAIPIPPECPEGCEVLPVELSIRNIKSPDAERFRKAKGVDMDKINKSKTKKATDMTAEHIQLVIAASCIADFINVPSNSDDDALIVYNEDVCIQFLKDYPVALEQITVCVLDGKKYESLSPIGNITL